MMSIEQDVDALRQMLETSVSEGTVETATLSSIVKDLIKHLHQDKELAAEMLLEKDRMQRKIDEEAKVREQSAREEMVLRADLHALKQENSEMQGCMKLLHCEVDGMLSTLETLCQEVTSHHLKTCNKLESFELIVRNSHDGTCPMDKSALKRREEQLSANGEVEGDGGLSCADQHADQILNGYHTLNGCEDSIDDVQRSVTSLETKLQNLLMKLESKRMDDDLFIDRMLERVEMSNSTKEQVLQDLVWTEEDLEEVKRSLREERRRNEELASSKSLLEREIETLAERLIKEQLLLDSLRIDREDEIKAKQSFSPMVEDAMRAILHEVEEMTASLLHLQGQHEDLSAADSKPLPCDAEVAAPRGSLEERTDRLGSEEMEKVKEELRTLRERLAELGDELEGAKREKKELESSWTHKEEEEKNMRVELLLRENEELKARLDREGRERASQRVEERERQEVASAQLREFTIRVQEISEDLSDFCSDFGEQQVDPSRLAEQEKDLQSLRDSVQLAVEEMRMGVKDASVLIFDLRGQMIGDATVNEEQSLSLTSAIAGVESLCWGLEGSLMTSKDLLLLAQGQGDGLMKVCDELVTRTSELITRCVSTYMHNFHQRDREQLESSKVVQELMEQLREMEEELKQTSACSLASFRRMEELEQQTRDSLAALDRLVSSLCATFSSLQEETQAAQNDQVADKRRKEAVEQKLLRETENLLLEVEKEKQQLQRSLVEQAQDRKMLSQVMESFRALARESLQACEDMARERQEMSVKEEAKLKEERGRLLEVSQERDDLMKRVREVEEKMNKTEQWRLEEENEKAQVVMRLQSLEGNVESLSDVTEKVKICEVLLEEMSRRNSDLHFQLHRQQLVAEDMSKNNTLLQDRLVMLNRNVVEEDEFLVDEISRMSEDCRVIEKTLISASQEIAVVLQASKFAMMSHLQTLSCLRDIRTQEKSLVQQVKIAEHDISGHIDDQAQLAVRQAESIAEMLINSLSLVSNEQSRNHDRQDAIERRMKESELIKSSVSHQLFNHCKDLSDIQDSLSSCHVSLRDECSTASASSQHFHHSLLLVVDGMHSCQQDCLLLLEGMEQEDQELQLLISQVDAVASLLRPLGSHLASLQRQEQENAALREEVRRREAELIASHQHLNVLREEAAEKERAMHSDFQERLDYVDDMAEEEKTRLKQEISLERQKLCDLTQASLTLLSQLDERAQELEGPVQLLESLLLQALSSLHRGAEAAGGTIDRLLAQSQALLSLVNASHLKSIAGLEEEEKRMSMCEKAADLLEDSSRAFPSFASSLRQVLEDNRLLRCEVGELEDRLRRQEENLRELHEAKQRASGSMHQQESNLINHISDMLEEIASQKCSIDKLTEELEATKRDRDTSVGELERREEELKEQDTPTLSHDQVDESELKGLRHIVDQSFMYANELLQDINTLCSIIDEVNEDIEANRERYTSLLEGFKDAQEEKRLSWEKIVELQASWRREVLGLDSMAEIEDVILAVKAQQRETRSLRQLQMLQDSENMIKILTGCSCASQVQEAKQVGRPGQRDGRDSSKGLARLPEESRESGSVPPISIGLARKNDRDIQVKSSRPS
ncbi:hypothetical protein GUITHDRAFT_134334 [Guillardia theta CCMP2712]|uniref:Uncharacterized protein n=1 Tax=Guillardia theta (strain CCMP2712) TaxID=905079 RepID=L1JTJ1_GUITC|nr:hypothetical protein GUITHDRAFT_134334 [Guillardia theta CCMP2712]EKX51393.1 hypothetical protein GUITHDRAFT_134334 [Guillardia theta CCMP2712]|eukprot:XP_005838373.1 hypothetical protein GUITHDRAFT_134334 [Guillardia theta CCMP2712]